MSRSTLNRQDLGGHGLDKAHSDSVSDMRASIVVGTYPEAMGKIGVAIILMVIQRMLVWPNSKN